MDKLINHLSENQIQKLSKKNQNLLVELQKEIHSQKIEHYDQLRRFYWTVSVALLVGFFGTPLIASGYFLLIYTILILSSFIISLIGGKLYFIDKVSITKKAVAKSKFLDAMEIETLKSHDIKKKKIGLSLILLSCLLYLGAMIIIIIK